jgi:hypothetical protein
LTEHNRLKKLFHEHLADRFNWNHEDCKTALPSEVACWGKLVIDGGDLIRTKQYQDGHGHGKSEMRDASFVKVSAKLSLTTGG